MAIFTQFMAERTILRLLYSRFYSVLVAALGPPSSYPSRTDRPHCSLLRLRGPNLTFGKLPFGKLHIWEKILWESISGVNKGGYWGYLPPP